MPDFPISGPVGIVLMLLLGGLGAPFPEEVVLAAGGLAAHPSREALAITILAGWLGVLAGDSLIYSLGRFFGGNVLRHRWMARHLTPEKLQRFETYLAQRGPKIILVIRFMTGLRAPAFFSAGAMRFPYRTFLMFDGLAAMVSVPALVVLGFTMGKHLELIQQQMEKFGLYIGLGVVLLILTFFAYRWWKGEEGEVEP
jgi:membrane protein DedA with SNARE-associated domain